MSRDELWTHGPGEPPIWFHRFHDYYLLAAGNERTIEAAYQKWRQDAAKCGKRPGARPHRLWYENSVHWDWEGRAAAFDERERARHRDEHASTVRRLQEKHILQLKAASNKIILAVNSTDFERLGAGELIRLMCDVIKCERLIYGEPISVQQHQHVGGDGGAIRSESTQVSATFTPSPEQMANVMMILAQHNALEDPPEEDEPARVLAGPSLRNGS